MNQHAHPRPERPLANREFLALLASQGLSVLGDQLARIAVAVLVFERTGSALAASATYAIGYLAYLLGGPFLATLADRYPRRAVMIVCDLGRAPLIALMTVAHAPLALLFGCLLAAGLFTPPFDAARSGTQPEILEGEAYARGNALLNTVIQLGQVVGFAVGGALVALLGARTSLALDAVSFLLSAALIRALVRERPAAQDSRDRLGVLRDTAAGLAVLRDNAEMRRLLVLTLLVSAACIAPEGLAVPVAHELGRGSTTAGLLTACVPTGVVVGGFTAAHRPPQQRAQLLLPLVVLGIVPLLLTSLTSQPVLLGAIWFVSGLGSGVSVITGPAYIQACPPALRGRAYGLAVTSLSVVQGVALLLVGLASRSLSARSAVSACAALVLLLLVGTVGLGSAISVRTQGTRSPSR